MTEYKCSQCGYDKFEQDMKETYQRFFNSRGEIMGVSSLRYRKIEVDGLIVCKNCGKDLDNKIQKEILRKLK